MRILQTFVQQLRWVALCFLYWLLLFQAGRLLFFAITREQAAEFDFQILGLSMLHGLWLDASVSGYFTLLFLLLQITGDFAAGNLLKLQKAVHYTLLFISTLAVIANAVLYTYWFNPLDNNALKYLKHPEEAAASISWLHMIIPIGMGVLLYYLFLWLYRWLPAQTVSRMDHNASERWINNGFRLLFCLILIIPIRGGTGIVPVNLSFVYFHKEVYPNHAAYNPVWNVLYSFSESDRENAYRFMPREEAERKFKLLQGNNLYNEPVLSDTAIRKPNVLILVLESFLSRLVDRKYKGEEVCPYFNSLSRDGIYFSNLYASGDRSDKGLVSVFSGYPALPKAALVQFPAKFPKIPSLFKDAAEAGYHTAFYYGGNLDFANLRSYFISCGVKQITGGENYTQKSMYGKWGVHDAYMLRQLTMDLGNMKRPFFAGLFTLSNHEPYDLPGRFYFGRNSADEEYMSAVRYTDDCLRTFMEDFKRTDLWKQTLVVLVADHGVTRLGIKKVFDPEKYHIPMIWTGGVIKQPAVISTICSHTDIPLLIATQTGLKPQKPYPFSTPLNKNGKPEFACYYYNDGLGMVTPGCKLIYDNISGEYQDGFCKDDSVGQFGKAYLQVLSNDFIK